MGPRIDSHDSTTSSASNHHHHHSSNVGRVHQRRRDSSMPRTFSSSYIVEMSSDDTPSNSPTQSRPLISMVASESQASLLSPEASSSPSKTGIRRRLSMHQTSYLFSEWKTRLILIWLFHFAASVLVLYFGLMENGGTRKYIPIDVETVEQTCDKAFVNVYARSLEEPDAFFCCDRSNPSNSPLICRQPPSYLLFARRLSRFPDAWLLPLLPLLIRGAFYMYQRLQARKTGTFEKSEQLLARRRFYLYMALIQLRGWVLYLVLDTIENTFVRGAAEDSTCWYDDLLHSHSSHCQGQALDFSDHVVLYYAQLLPIALMEALHSFVLPFWGKSGGEDCQTSGTWKGWTPALIVLSMANLYSATSMGAYKTAAYFHTAPEIWIGFAVSLAVQIPLFILQCTQAMPKARQFFFGTLLS